jgi:hypothetical protein
VQCPILSGVFADQFGDFRTRLPRNYIPVPMPQGISKGYLRPADGIRLFGTGQGPDRGGVRWNDTAYRVSGTKLIRVDADGSVTVLGDVGTGGPVSLDYSFDRLAIASGHRLYLWDGATLTQVTDPDLGPVFDVLWTGGYFMTTDGTSIVVTELLDPTAVDPLKYGSAESDPDPVKAVTKLGDEVFVLGRYSIQAFQNVGGAGFPFAVVESALVKRGVIGTHAWCELLGTFCFVGGARNEPPSVYLMTPGSAQRVATREIDTLLQGYTEAQLAEIVMDARVDKGHAMAYIHLPDRCLVFDANASKVAGESVWFTADSGVAAPAQYRARGLVWCYDRWIVGDPTGSGIGTLVNDTMEHFGAVIGWDFGTLVLYADGGSAIVHSIELIGLPGRVDFGKDPVIWTSYTEDGEEPSQERAISAGKQGQRGKRLQWRGQGQIRHYRMQQFRGTSDARISFARLDMSLEPLMTGAGNG